MGFDIALSGIRAASNELNVTGNNIANASTTGFKRSRVEFGDVFATSVLGAGGNAVGSGVRVLDTRQNFSDGGITITERPLDLAINGTGFFVLNQDGETLYTRAGEFGLDDNGFIVSNTGARLQGFSADSEGNISGIASDLEIPTSNIDPQRTTLAEVEVNLDAGSEVLQSVGSQFISNGPQIGEARIGLIESTTTTLSSNGFTLPINGVNFSTDSIDFSVQLTNSDGNNGLVPVSLSSTAGVPASVDDFNDLRTLVSVINAQLSSPGGGASGIDVVAEAIDNQDGTYGIDFRASIEGESSNIDIINGASNVGASSIGLSDTELSGNGFTLPVATNFATGDITFNVTLANAAAGNGTAAITLDAANGVPNPVSTAVEAQTLVDVINTQLAAAPVDVQARLVDDGTNLSIAFSSNAGGTNPDITLAAVSASANDIGIDAAALPTSVGLTDVSGLEQVSNGYSAQELTVTDPDGNEVDFTSRRNVSAAVTAAELNALQGITATATTNATITDFNNTSTNLRLTLNGVELAGETLSSLATEINGLTTTRLPGITAVFDGATLLINSSGGADLSFQINGEDGDNITVLGGNTGSQPQTLEIEDGTTPGFVRTDTTPFNGLGNGVVVGGELNIIVEEGFRLSNINPPAAGLFQAFAIDDDGFVDTSGDQFTEVTLNDFDPGDQSTYNSATSLTIFDSLGNPHVLTQFFVRQSFNPELPITNTNSPNHWQVHVQIDGEDVGDPSSAAAPRATFDLFFDENGAIDNNRTQEILITNWTPLGPDGQPNGAEGPQNLLAGAATPLPDPPTSSNFVVDLTQSTQRGANFSVDSVDQNGFTTGRLAGVNIDDAGILFARYTNGESLVLGQLALANFPNEEGLQPVGDTAWAENFESGEPSIGPANTGALGAIQSGALEESNVDLSAELVNLIIAQRNYQANAQTIETEDAVTQTIINLN